MTDPTAPSPSIIVAVCTAKGAEWDHSEAMDRVAGLFDHCSC